MKRITRVFLGVVLVVAAHSPSWAVDLKFAGSTTCQLGFMFDAAEAYKQKTGKTISVMGGSTGAGVRGVLFETIDIGGASRPISDKELAKGIVPYTVAWDAIAIIVNKKNPIKNISMEHLKKMNTGELFSWKTVGGPDKKVVVVTSHVGSATKKVFQKIVMNKEEYRSDAVVVNSTRDEVDKVVANEFAIGAVSLSFADPTKVKIINVDGISPSPENISSRKYKISRPLSLLTSGPAQGEAKEFIDFMLSERGQRIIGGTKFIRAN